MNALKEKLKSKKDKSTKDEELFLLIELKENDPAGFMLPSKDVYYIMQEIKNSLNNDSSSNRITIILDTLIISFLKEELFSVRVLTGNEPA